MQQIQAWAQWLFENKEWVFSGIGIIVLSGIGFLIRLPFRSSRPRQITPRPEQAGQERRAANPEPKTDDVPAHWQGVIPDSSRYRVVTGMSDSISLGTQIFSFEYGPQGHAAPLILGGKTPVRADIQFTCHIVNPYNALYKTGEYALNVLQPRFLVRARAILEQNTLAKLRASREPIAKEIVEALAPEFDEAGVSLDTVTIGALEKLPAPPLSQPETRQGGSRPTQ